MDTRYYRHATDEFLDALASRGIVKTEREVEAAIFYGLERLRDIEGWTSIPDDVDYGSYRWHQIEDDVIEHLELDYDGVVEVAL